LNTLGPTDFLDLVRRRRSVRKYRPDPVPRDALDRCFEAARWAPSACNAQPWSFIAVEDADVRAALGRAAFSGIYAMNRFAAEAPVLVVVLTERSSYAARLGGWLKGTRYCLLDVGIACEHLVLQAAAEGLGACWLGWFSEAGVRRVLGLPRSAKIDVIISMGYPAGPVAAPKARRPLDDVRRYV